MNDIEQRTIMEKLVGLTEENNMMLHRMQSRARWGTFFQILYWIVIIGLGVGAFYFVQPYIETFNGGVSQLKSDINSFKATFGSATPQK